MVCCCVLQCFAMRCSAMSHVACAASCVAVCCTVLQCVAVSQRGIAVCVGLLQCVAMRCSATSHVDHHSDRNSLQHSATHQLTATHCNSLHYTATHCTIRLMLRALPCRGYFRIATHCSTLQHAATHCNTQLAVSLEWCCCVNSLKHSVVLQCVVSLSHDL